MGSVIVWFIYLREKKYQNGQCSDSSINYYKCPSMCHLLVLAVEMRVLEVS